MRLGEKLHELRILEGAARGLGRPLTQEEVSRGIQRDLGGRVSQPYLINMSHIKVYQKKGGRIIKQPS